MRFEVSSADLLKHLNIASGAISNNPVLPILEDYLFKVRQNQLTITATNLETTIISQLDVISDEDGIIAIPAKILLETLRALPEQPITISIDENDQVKILSAFGVYKLSGNAPDDFPSPPVEDDVETLVLPSKKILKGITNTVFATSNDELRQAMTGVCVHIDFTKINFVATDAHKLAKYTVGNLKTDISRLMVVPKKGLNILKSAFNEDIEVTVSFNRTNIFFSFGRTKIICRLIDAKYPEYNTVIPIDNEFEVLVNRKDLISSLRRIAIYANKSTNQVIINIVEKSMTISAQDLDFSNEATEQLNCTFNGEPMTIGYNAKFLAEMLSIIETDEIRLMLSQPGKAGILIPTQEDADESLIMLVMPVLMGN